MDIINHTVLAWLEEDNQKLGHFRVRPLLRETGPFTPAEVEEWRDDGYIRVVPDKSEQRSCKERLRSLGDFCLLTLTGAHADKFKPNKSYAPAKGEKNRYIVYSNAVETVPEALFYEVIPESMLPRAATARAYARLGGKIHGPVERQSGRDLEDACPLPPDDPRIFSVTLPDGTVRLFYWPTAETPAPETAAAPDEPEAPAEPDAALTAIDQIKALDRQVLKMVQETEHPDEAKKPQDVLIADDAGTPLYHAQVETEAPKRRRNSLAQAVENSRKAVVKAEKPAEKKKPEKARPADKETAPDAGQPLAERLAAEWAETPSRGELVGRILALRGARELFARALGGTEDPVLAALKAQLQDTEAERLMTVMNLNQARAQEAQYRESLAAGLVKSERKELDELRAETEKTAETLKALEAQRAELIRGQGNAILKTGEHAVWPGEAEEDAPLATVARRISECMNAAGFDCDGNDALALLIVFAFSGDTGMRVRAQSDSDARDAAAALTAALGGRTANGAPDTRVLKGGNAVLAMLRTTGPCLPASGACTDVYLTDAAAGGKAMPEIRVHQSGALPRALPASPAVDFVRLRRKLNEVRSPLGASSAEVITQVRALCAEQGIVLPLCLVRGMIAFAEAAQNLMEGGISAALDRALLVYAVPQIPPKAAEGMKELSPALSLTRAALKLP